MRIFIGSSTDKKPTAKSIKKALEEDNHDVVLWWEHAAFRSGDFTLQRLIDMSDIFHGAVFVFGKDDLVWMNRTTSTPGRRSGKPIDKVRDNVILEYGLFVGKHGTSKVAIVTDEGMKLPSDLQGVTYIIKGNKHLIKVRETFMEEGDAAHRFRYDFHVYANRVRSLQTIPRPPENWSSRLLYVGEKGAHLWSNVETDPHYINSREHSKVIARIGQMAAKIDIKVDNVISIGPGIGSLDKSVIQNLRIPTHKCYIPIDINYHLLLMAAKSVDDVDPATTVPFAVHGDFEQGMNEIGSMLKELIGHNMFLMLGGTFGNIEESETTFLGGLRSCMREGDFFLLDTFVKSNDYSDNNDSFRQLDQQPESVQKLIAYGASLKANINYEHMVNDLQNQISLGPISSEIPQTEGFCFCINQDQRPVLHVRRYHSAQLRNFFVRIGFEVIKQSRIKTSNGAADRGLYLLRRVD